VVFDKDKTATAAYQLKQLSLSCTWNLNSGLIIERILSCLLRVVYF